MAEGEVTVGLLADRIGESQPKISRHLAYLRNSGIVSARRDGKWIYYGICMLKNAASAQVLQTTISLLYSDEIADAFALSIDTANRGKDIYVETHSKEVEPEEMDIFLL